MLNLHDREWREFELNRIFPNVQRGKRLKTADHTLGETPYVSSSAINNGADNFIGNKVGVREFSGCLTVANSGSVGKTFYHPYSFIASDHVTQLRNDNINSYAYRFILPLVSRFSEKYNFNHEINDVRMKREKILLPSTADGTPDWAFMEQYVREREELLLAKYKRYILKKHALPAARISLPLENTDWREFFIEETATIESGRDIYEAERQNGKTPYIGASSQNNGICHLVSNVNETKEAGGISVNRNGSVGYAFYHPYPALYSNDCRKLRLNIPNENIGLFIAAQITAQREKYNYGYKMGTGRLKRQLILLPVAADGLPDWDYMERYSKEEQGQQVHAYLNYLEKRP